VLKNINEHKNQIVIFTLFLISLDAYNIMNIPIQYIGFVILFFTASILIGKKLFFLSTILYIFLLVFLSPILFTFRISNNFYWLNVNNIRLFNLITFFVVFLFCFTVFNIDKSSNFFNYLEKFILIISLVSLYIYFAQIFDLPEFVRNRSGTNLIENPVQTTFWPYQNHRLLGTFREPLLFVSFITPLYLLTLKFKKDPSHIFIITCSLSIGLAGSDLFLFYFSIFILIFLLTTGINTLKINHRNSVNRKILLGLALPILFSFVSIVECNVNTNSSDCNLLEIKNDSNQKIYKFDAYENLTNFDIDRTNIFNYFIVEGISETSLGLSRPTNNYNNYINYNLNIEQYLINRTLPEYLSTRYFSQNFGTGNYSYLKFTPNFQNLFIYIYLTYGSLLMVFIGSIFIFSIYISKNRKDVIYLHLIIFLFFLIPIEELTGFTGLIFGICYKMLKRYLFYDPIV